MKNRINIRRKVGYFISGILAGAANGLFGGGAGMIVVPSMGYFGDVEGREAHATTIAVVTPLSFLSALVYSVKGVTDYALAWQVGGGVIVGGVIGALFLRRVPKTVLTIIFYGVMICAGIRLAV